MAAGELYGFSATATGTTFCVTRQCFVTNIDTTQNTPNCLLSRKREVLKVRRRLAGCRVCGVKAPEWINRIDRARFSLITAWSLGPSAGVQCSRLWDIQLS